jgi:dimethylhistidine N-methyltransferase
MISTLSPLASAFQSQRFLQDALEGLRKPRKTLPCKYFYDETGSALFDRICDLEEYYLTRTERAIMLRHGGEMAAKLGEGVCLIEYGSGSSLKTRILLDHLEQPSAYIPIDISREHLYRSACGLAEAYPNLRIFPVHADYTSNFDLPPLSKEAGRRVVYFPGSTFGNFEPEERGRFLQQLRSVCGAEGGLLIGIDLKKSPSVIEAAYNDAEGVTAAFNLNLLHRLNRECGADFQVEFFRHRAVYNSLLGRIEMHLVSVRDQTVRLADERIVFQEGESIQTESSYKYSLKEYQQLVERWGFQVETVWTDPQDLFSVQFLTCH